MDGMEFCCGGGDNVEVGWLMDFLKYGILRELL